MRIFQQALKVVFISFLLFSLTIFFRNPHKEFNVAKDDYVYSAGNAPESDRSEILTQLVKFQEGYTNRDLDQLDPYMEELFSKDNTLVIGTMPDEIYIGQEEVSDLIYSDWNSWGDCTFLIDKAHISAAEDVAWISTIGYVKFDIPSFLVLPLRLSAVMVKEDLGWKIQFMQF